MMKKTEDAEKLLMKLQVLTKKILRRKTLLYQVQDRTGFRQQAAVLSCLLGRNYRLPEKTGIAMGTLMVALIRKYGPKVGKAVFMAIKATLKK